MTMLEDNRPVAAWYQELVIEFADKTKTTFFIELTRSGTHIPRRREIPAAWTLLPFQKCPDCPLSDKVRHCPAALSLEDTLSKLIGRTSFETVKATAVDGANRTSSVEWPLQEVGAAFVQLAVFASGCPVGSDFKGMLLDLRPFTTSRELARHLVRKVLVKHKGEIEGSRKEILAKLEPLREVLLHLFKRLSTEIQGLGGDAIPNSIVKMDAFAGNLSLQLERLLGEMAAELGWERPAELPKRGLWARVKSLFA